ncbi:Hsp20/alpha crystallin family protein [Hymenobacter terricola]|uniref:Hsp20/alpha crystallin family protein n=1 Tax=Hymenobacter terricola TaxID=2819236 RepID=UPI001B304E42|nr:Hsp20/alpha crystallin family protein [Hymenobacter terricola]
MYNQQATDSYSQQGAHAGCGGRGRHWGRHFGGQHGHRGGPPWAKFFGGAWQPVPVNIETTETSFVLTLFAAGLVKENITLKVENDVLIIAYQGADATPEAEGAADPRYTRREFRNASFERAFQLNGKVLAEGITASYAEGILTVTLPKNPATNQPAQTIGVS